MTSQFFEVPSFPVLSGEEAVLALQEFIREVKEEKSEELTFKQTKTLIKVAKGLITYILVTAVSVKKNKEEKHIIKRFKRTVIKSLRK